MTGAGRSAEETVPPGVVLTPAAVAGRLGVAVATLRSWDRRHGLGPGHHEAGRHRRYTTGDLRRLDRVVELIRQGVPVACAAAAVAANLPAGAADLSGGAADLLGGAAGLLGGAAGLAAGAAGLPGGAADVLGGAAGLPGGAVGLPAGAVGLAAGAAMAIRLRRLREAAERLDHAAIGRMTGGFLREFGTVDAWRLLLVPFLIELGERCAAPGGPVQIEHVATSGILAALHGLAPPEVTGQPSVLLACAPDEQHSLPLEVLMCALAERGRGGLLLGARVPAPALLAAAHAILPDQVVVWAHTPQLAWRVPVDELVQIGAGVVLAGPGWSGMRLPAGARRPMCLHEAIAHVCEPDRAGLCSWNCPGNRRGTPAT